jgi:hypothetical protein
VLREDLSLEYGLRTNFDQGDLARLPRIGHIPLTQT